MNHPRQWVQEHFFKGFLATMVLKGHNSVETYEEGHQRRFQRVADHLLRVRQTVGSSHQLDRLPRFFVKSRITGRYQDFDDALIGLQNGLLSAQNPYYVTVKINCSNELASQIVSDYSEEERALFERLVDLYLAESSPAEEEANI